MGYIDLIAFSLGRRDEVPNQELARKLADQKNEAGIKEIAGHLFDKKPVHSQRLPQSALRSRIYRRGAYLALYR